jgi:hypothetical protein
MTNAATSSLPALAGAPGQTNAPLRDIRPPVEIPPSWLWLVWVAGAIAVAALGYWLWKLWQKKQKTSDTVIQIPAHLRALRKLEQALDLLHSPREFCITVSDTVRWYLEQRFEFRAPERTTEEFLHELQSTNLLTHDQKQSLGLFLERCDLVKFARYEPGEPELRDLHGAAVRLVEETQPPPPNAPGAHQDLTATTANRS